MQKKDETVQLVNTTNIKWFVFHLQTRTTEVVRNGRDAFYQIHFYEIWNRDRKTEIDRQRQTAVTEDRDRKTARQTETERDRKTETERQRQRQTEIDRLGL